MFSHFSRSDFKPDLRSSILFKTTGLLFFVLASFIWALPATSRGDAISENGDNSLSSSGTTVYVWDSRRIITQSIDDKNIWQHFHYRRVNRLLLSLNGEQIRSLGDDLYQKELSHFIRCAGDKAIRVELLLGEPLWILPSYRQDLLDIVGQLHRFKFTGLHLDLEPNQLDQKPFTDQYLLKQLLQTIKAVKLISPWPVGLSIHPRYLKMSAEDFCLGCELGNLKIDEIILMIYVANPNRVIDIAQPILTRYPELNFSIAQSVEPILSTDESYATRGGGRFQLSMKKLRKAMRPAVNFTTIAIQSWEDWVRLKP